MLRISGALMGAMLFFAATTAAAKSCEMITKKEKVMVSEVLGIPVKAGEPCADLTQKCPLGKEVAEEVCQWVLDGMTRKQIEARLSARQAAAQSANIVLNEAFRAGPAHAPVVLVEYACTRCPMCRVVTADLHREVTTGRLKGMAKLYFRPFPLSNHPGSAQGGVALLAAARLGKFWPYTLALYDRFDEFAPAKLPAWAAELGLDQNAFKRLMGDPKLRKDLVASKKEGLRNDVKATPTLFINGRRYDGALDMAAIAAAVKEEIGRN